MATCEGLPLPKRVRYPGKHTGRLTAKQFRAEVWTRDGGRDRADGSILQKQHVDDRLRGEVAHFRGRRVMPEWVRDPMRAILLSAQNHWLSDHRGNYRLKMTDPDTGEKADDGTKKILFTMHDRFGNVLWSRIS